MVFALGIGWWGAVLLALATLTTNFVNIYMSALAFKSLRPDARDATAVWLIGGIGAALGLLSNAWIEQFAGFTLLLAGCVRADRRDSAGALLHPPRSRCTFRISTTAGGPYGARRGWSLAGTAAWTIGAMVFYLTQSIRELAPEPGRVDCRVHRAGARPTASGQTDGKSQTPTYVGNCSCAP